MWIKIIGGAVLLFSAWAMGKRLSDSLRMRYENLRAFGTALVMLEGEMSYAGNSIDRAFKNIAKAIPMQGFFVDVARKVQTKGARSAWRDELAEKQLYLTADDIRILSALSVELGISNTENQIKSIRYCRELLKNAESEAEERYKTLSGLYRKLCFCAASILLIIFV